MGLPDFSKLNKTYQLSEEELEALKTYQTDRRLFIRQVKAIDLMSEMMQNAVLRRLDIKRDADYDISVSFDLEDGKVHVKYTKAEKILVPDPKIEVPQASVNPEAA